MIQGIDYKTMKQINYLWFLLCQKNATEKQKAEILVKMTEVFEKIDRRIKWQRQNIII